MKKYLAILLATLWFFTGYVFADVNDVNGQRFITMLPSLMNTRNDDPVVIVSPTGSGDRCTLNSPCNLLDLETIVEPGSVVLLRGGVYDVTSNIKFFGGDENAPVLYRSFPGEWAIFDGASNTKGDNIFVRALQDYTIIRDIEIRNMPRQGLYIRGNYNIIDGVISHHNTNAGIHVFSAYEDFPYEDEGSYNTITYCTVHDNSDVGLNGDGMANGGNADGILISSGEANVVTYNTVYANSDDGIDVWASTNSYIGFNRVSGSGLGDGNGMGIKAGGGPNGEDANVEYNIVFNNKELGLTFNSGEGQRFLYNTSYNNGTPGINIGGDSIVINNIDADGTGDQAGQIIENNSWQIGGSMSFESLDPNSDVFLYPTAASGLQAIGAFGGQPVTTHKYRKIAIIGDSTVHNTAVGEQGWGDALPALSKSPAIVTNYAVSGASTKSFYENYWAPVLQDLEPGSILLIQFGHNDAKANDPARYTSPGRPPAYRGDYQDFLTHFITEARAKGARPYLITSVSRAHYANNELSRSHGYYPAAMKRTAEALGVPLLDLEAWSWDAFSQLSEAEALSLYFYDDRTHFNENGAQMVASWVVELACELDTVLCEQFNEVEVPPAEFAVFTTTPFYFPEDGFITVDVTTNMVAQCRWDYPEAGEAYTFDMLNENQNMTTTDSLTHSLTEYAFADHELIVICRADDDTQATQYIDVLHGSPPTP